MADLTPIESLVLKSMKELGFIRIDGYLRQTGR